MQPIRQNKRKGRQLLVAAVGIASVSYVTAIQGCADIEPSDQPTEASEVGDEAASDVAQSQQSLTIKDSAINASAILRPRLPPSGNLMPGPGGDVIGGGGGVIIKVPIPVGNLMAPIPIDEVALPAEVLENALVEQR